MPKTWEMTDLYITVSSKGGFLHRKFIFYKDTEYLYVLGSSQVIAVHAEGTISWQSIQQLNIVVFQPVKH